MKRIIITLAAMASLLGAAARQPQQGYRGFIECSNHLRTDPAWYNPKCREIVYFTGLSTSHGYQFSELFYLGGGFDAEYCPAYGLHMLVPFIDARFDALFGRFSPYGDLRVGFSLTDGGGVYFSPTVGYRFNWGRKAAINLGAGLAVKGYTADVFQITIDEDGYTSVFNIGRRVSAEFYFRFSVGVEF